MFRQTLHMARPAAAGVLWAADSSPTGLAEAAAATTTAATAAAAATAAPDAAVRAAAAGGARG